jgi:hypothetical protein
VEESRKEQALPEHLQRAVPQQSQLPVHRMLPGQESQHWRAAVGQAVHRDRQPHIAARKFQSCLQRFDGVIAASRGSVNLGEIQIELRLVALHAHRGVAQSLRLAPLLFGTRQHYAQVGHVVRIVLV